MKAVVFHEHGGPEKLQYTDVPDPGVGPFDVLVKVKAAALNHLDLWVRAGIPGSKIPMPHISGTEGAGEVVSVGASVTSVKPGDRVIVSPPWSCGRCEFCLINQDSLCRHYGMIGVKRNGCFAELVSAPEETIHPLGDLTFEEGASVPLVFQTAWHMLVDRGRVKPGDDVLVQAAGSGVGIAAVQIAKLFGARVFATAGSDAKLTRAKDLGADFTINYSTQNFAEEIATITSKRGVDIIVEHIGADQWDRNIQALARNGRLVTCGATSGPKVSLDLRFVFSRELSVIGSYMGGKRDLLDALRFIRERKIKPVIDSVFPLEQVREAEEKMADRNLFGKIVIKV